MSEEDWSAEGIKRRMEAMESDLERDPLVVAREAAARRQQKVKDERIAAALPGRLREQERLLKRNVPNDVIDVRLAMRREAQGTAKGPEPRLPAELEKARVEERLRFAREQMADQFGGQVKTNVDILELQVEWNQHVKDLDLKPRDRIRYEFEADGKQLTESELSHEEARINAYKMWRDGSYGPSRTAIDEHIAVAKANGTWPPPELHTGPGSKPRPHPHIYTYDLFKAHCEANPVHQHNAGASNIGSSPMVNERAEKPLAPIRRFQWRQPGHMETPAFTAAEFRGTPRDVKEHDGSSMHREPSVSIRKLHQQKPPQFGIETALDGGEAQMGHHEVPGHESHVLRVPGRQGLGVRLVNILRPISRRVADRISRMISGDKEYRALPPAVTSVHNHSNESGLDAVRYPDHRQMSDSRVTTRDYPTARAREARASMIAAREGESRAVVYSR